MADKVWIVAPDNTLTPGFFRVRLVRGGPFVPARLWVEDGERDPDTGELLSDVLTLLEVDGKRVDPFAPGYTLMGEPISEAEYRYMTKAAAWDRQYAPSAPAANPDQPVNVRTVPPIF
jgi:hypothetical protein